MSNESITQVAINYINHWMPENYSSYDGAKLLKALGCEILCEDRFKIDPTAWRIKYEEWADEKLWDSLTAEERVAQYDQLLAEIKEDLAKAQFQILHEAVSKFRETF